MSRRRVQEGYRFLKLDAGMTEVLRPSLYGAQHPIHVITEPDQLAAREKLEQVVVGHCCESGDLLTPAPVTRKPWHPAR